MMLILVSGVNIPVTHSEETRIAVLLSLDAQPYKETLAGFQQYLLQQGIEAQYKVYSLEGDPSKAARTIHEIKNDGVRLILTLGTLATETALNADMNTPIIAGMVLDEERLRKAPNATGVVLEFPLETQFNLLRRFLPKARNVGVIYNPEDNRKKIEAAVKVSKRMGFKLEAQAVRMPKELPAVLKNLAKRADVLWGIPDKLILNPQTAKQILLFSFRNRIPFIGLSTPWVKAGALYSLSWDYADLGMQCGTMAFKILSGVRVSSIPPASPRKIQYCLNQKTVEHMKIEISEELIRDAHRVF
jgi:putative ABC transport system substrate-binding protein